MHLYPLCFYISSTPIIIILIVIYYHEQRHQESKINLHCLFVCFRLSDLEADLFNLTKISACESETRSLHIKLLEANVISLKFQLSTFKQDKEEIEGHKKKFREVERVNQCLKMFLDDTPTKWARKPLTGISIKDMTVEEQLQTYKRKIPQLKTKIWSVIAESSLLE